MYPQKNRQIGCVLHIFDLLEDREAKNIVNTGLEAQNHGIYSIILPGPSKKTGFCAVFSVLQDAFSIYGKHKGAAFYDVFAF